MLRNIRAGRIRHLPGCERGLAALEFAMIAPILLALVFGIVTYGLYFTIMLGVHHAAAEGARAAMAGLSSGERATLAQARVQSVIAAYAPLIPSQSPALAVTAAPDSSGVFKVSVTYNMSNSGLLTYGAFLPMPSAIVAASVTVSNGSY